MMKDMFLSELHLKIGEGLDPHYHPEADELCYIIRGEIHVRMVNPGQQAQNQTYRVTAGQIVHTPAGWYHWLTSFASDSILLMMHNRSNPFQCDAASVWSELTCDASNHAHPMVKDRLQAVQSRSPTVPAAPTLFIPKRSNKTTNHS